MPLFKLTCPNGHRKNLLTTTSSWDKVPNEKKKCHVCSETMSRSGTGPTANVKESLDNGLQVRKVERYADAERLYKERNKTADSNAGGRNFS